MNYEKRFGRIEGRAVEAEKAWDDWMILSLSEDPPRDHKSEKERNYRSMGAGYYGKDRGQLASFISRLLSDACFTLEKSLDVSAVPSGEDPLTEKERASIQRLLELLRDPKCGERLLMLRTSNELKPEDLLKRLQIKHPRLMSEARKIDSRDGDWHKQAPAVEYGRIIGDQIHLNAESRKNILTVTNTHRSTADFLFAMKQSGLEFDPEKTALISFDHHTDTGPDTKLSKANVMRILLQEKLINRLLVIGPREKHYSHPVEGADFFFGEDLYQGGRPDTARFQERLLDIFSKWKSEGIKQFYLSVDIDGLQVDNLGLHATDYSPLRDLLNLLPVFSSFTGSFMYSISKEGWRYWKINARMMEEFVRRIGGPYYGVPVHWVTGAIQLAQEQGLQLGIEIKSSGGTSPTTRIIGDIVEVGNHDPKQHVERLTTALIEAIVSLSARKSSVGTY